MLTMKDLEFRILKLEAKTRHMRPRKVSLQPRRRGVRLDGQPDRRCGYKGRGLHAPADQTHEAWMARKALEKQQP